LLERYESSQFIAPTPEQIAEENAVQAGQIELARQWLLNLDAERRVAGIEQLAAYPTPESEQLMADTLKKDLSSDVRIAAAQNLSYIEAPTPATLQVLIHALQDQDQEVRLSALSSLQSYLHSLEDVSVEAKKIVRLLKNAAKNTQIPEDTRAVIKDSLADMADN